MIFSVSCNFSTIQRANMLGISCSRGFSLKNSSLGRGGLPGTFLQNKESGVFMDKSFLDLVADDDNLRIETDRLVLEPTVEPHAPLLWPLLQEENLYRFIPQAPPSIESLKRLYKVWEARKSPDEKEIWLNWVANCPDADQYIGQFQAGFDKENGFSIAYTVGKNYQRQSYATEGVTAIIGFLQTRMNAQSIKSWVDTRNEPSIRLMKRLGFRQVQTIKSADTFKGAVSDEFLFELKIQNL